MTSAVPERPSYIQLFSLLVSSVCLSMLHLSFFYSCFDDRFNPVSRADLGLVSSITDDISELLLQESVASRSHLKYWKDSDVFLVSPGNHRVPSPRTWRLGKRPFYLHSPFILFIDQVGVFYISGKLLADSQGFDALLLDIVFDLSRRHARWISSWNSCGLVSVPSGVMLYTLLEEQFPGGGVICSV